MSRHSELLAEIASLRKEQLKALADAVFINPTRKQIAENEERSKRIESLRRDLLKTPEDQRKSKIS